MKTNYFFMIAIAGIIAGTISVFAYSSNVKAKEPVAISYNPYEMGVYAAGIVESNQRNGSNINIYPEVSGTVISIPIEDGSKVQAGDTLLVISGTTQAAIAEKARAQVAFEAANLANAQQQFDKLNKAYQLNKKSISKIDLDNARNALVSATQALSVAESQLNADLATLNKYVIKAPSDAIVLRVTPSVGDYVSPVVGAYDPYTQGNLPIVQLGSESRYLQVRAYVDEILVPMLPDTTQIDATLFVRGMSDKAIPLKFVNIQPYTIPNIQLSDARTERVDVRVLPIIFQFEKPSDIRIYPGQLVDVYIKAKS